MDQFKIVFKKTTLYETFFLKIISVTEYGSISDFKKIDPEKFNIWSKMAENKYGEVSDDVYLEKAIFLPEYSKIGSIAFGVKNGDDNYIKYMVGDDEKVIIELLFNIIEEFRKKKLNGYLCGHNINGYDIPFLIKRGLKHGLKIPKSFTNSLTVKPWEANIVDIIDLWKFTGSDYVSLESIARTLGINPEENFDVATNNLNYWNGNIQLNTILNSVTTSQIATIIMVYEKLRDM